MNVGGNAYACVNLTDLRNQACIVGIGETDYTRGTPKSALELALDASLGAIEDAGIQPGDIDAVVLINRGKGRLKAPSLREVAPWLSPMSQ